MNNNDDRIEQFRAEVDGLKLKGSSSEGERRMLILGTVLAVAGVVLAVLGAITVSAAGGSPADQRANMAQGSFLGIALLIVGVGLYLRYSLARYLRFWLIRLTYESRANTDRIVDAIERAGGLPSTLETPLFPPEAYNLPLAGTETTDAASTDPEATGAAPTGVDTPASPESGGSTGSDATAAAPTSAGVMSNDAAPSDRVAAGAPAHADQTLPPTVPPTVGTPPQTAQPSASAPPTAQS